MNEKTSNQVSIWNANHPSRMTAIYILETLMDEGCIPDIKGMAWYKAEDIITEIVEARKENVKS